MEDKTKIDELFKEGLGGFSAEPPMDAWQNIQDELIAARRKKRMAVWRIAGTAAALILAFFSGYYFNSSTASFQLDETPFVTRFTNEGSSGKWKSTPQPLSKETTLDMDDNSEEGIEVIIPPGGPDGSRVSSGSLTSATSSKKDAGKDDMPVSLPSPDGLKSDTENISDFNNKAFAQIDFPAKIKVETPVELPSANTQINANTEVKDTIWADAANSAEADSPDKTINTPALANDEPFVYHEDSKSKKKKRPHTRSTFDIGAVASPTFAFNDVSPQAAQTTGGNSYLGTSSGNKQTDELQNSYAAGLNLSYRTGARWEVSTGLHINNWSQVSSDIFLTTDATGSISTSGVTVRGNTSTGAVTYNTGTNAFDATKLENVAPDAFYLIPDIEQQYQFLEVPLSVGYYLLDSKRWSFKLQAGFSGRILTQSDVRLVFEDGSTEKYDGLELKDFSLQLIGGTGLGYKATKNLNINLTPSIQYGLTPVNRNAEIETYFHQFLVYTGLSYSF